MKYKYKVFITNGEKHKVMNVDAEIYESGAFDYGNSKAMTLDINGEEQYFDIRYDTRYDGDDQKYIEMSINEFWNGENGAWKVERLERNPGFSCNELIDSWEALGHTLEELAQSKMPMFFKNENDEIQMVSVNDDISKITVQTCQNNGWIRTDSYYDDGAREQLFEK